MVGRRCGLRHCVGSVHSEDEHKDVFNCICTQG